MALVKGVNSNVTVVEADEYFVDRLDVDAWVTASEVQKPQSLVVATSILEDLPWASCVMSVDQSLAFPRMGTYFDPRTGYEVSLEVTPKRILVATFELAYHLLNNDGLLDESGSVEDLELGLIKLVNIEAAQAIPSAVRRLIKPLLINSGTNAVWRAN